MRIWALRSSGGVSAQVAQIGEWLQAVGEIEALSSIAGYAAEHPEDVGPSLSRRDRRFLMARASRIRFLRTAFGTTCS